MQQPSDDYPLEASGIEFLSKDRSHKIRTFPQFCPPDTVLIDDKCRKICSSLNTDDQLFYKVHNKNSRGGVIINLQKKQFIDLVDYLGHPLLYLHWICFGYVHDGF